MSERKIKNIASALLGIYVALILWITVLSREIRIGHMPYYAPFSFIKTALAEIQRSGIRSNFLGNVFLFIPVGMLVPIVSDWCRKWYKTVLVGIGFSLLIELVQLITARGCFDFDDLILNGIGAAVGYGVFRVGRSLIYCKPS